MTRERVKKHERIIEDYFSSWRAGDQTFMREHFDENVKYVECHGPVYLCREQTLKWFADWNAKGKVLEWEIKRFIHEMNATVVEWYFRCLYDEQIGSFDGVSIVEFSQDDLIISVQEFESRSEHYFPYGEECPTSKMA